MIYLLGRELDVTTERTCTKSGEDHFVLRQQARAERERLGFNIDESFALCLRCGKAVALAL